MKSIVFKEKNVIAVEEREKPKVIKDNDVIIKIILTGICGTDLRIFTGNFNGDKGVILGHEAIGWVETIGSSVTTVKPGDRVLIDPTLFDGSCYYCKRGQHNLCDNKAKTETGVDKDGTFAEYIVMPEEFVYLLPDDISDERAVLIEPLACVLNNLEAASIEFDDNVVILGGGPIGTIFAMLSEKYALSTTIVEKRPERINFLKKILMNTEVVNANDQDYLERISGRKRKPSVVVDATGMMLEEAIQIVSKGGTVVAMGFNSTYRATISPLYLTNNAIKIVGAGDYNNMFVRAIDLAQNVKLESLITHTYSLDQAEEAFQILTNGENSDSLVMKVVFKVAE
ncbi:zinc-dependent alcohol dehydrogenase [Anaerosacchariphilus polymeriproducens]|nr:alcohol dehydrogenase catalytic domain-containing protein [Anaerosacchariphilus polymeriproducens]